MEYNILFGGKLNQRMKSKAITHQCWGWWTKAPLHRHISWKNGRHYSQTATPLVRIEIDKCVLLYTVLFCVVSCFQLLIVFISIFFATMSIHYYTCHVLDMELCRSILQTVWWCIYIPTTFCHCSNMFDTLQLCFPFPTAFVFSDWFVFCFLNLICQLVFVFNVVDFFVR